MERPLAVVEGTAQECVAGEAVFDVEWWKEKFRTLMYPDQNAQTLAAFVVQTLHEMRQALQQQDAA